MKLEEDANRPAPAQGQLPTRQVLMVFDRIIKRRDGSRSLPILAPESHVSDASRLAYIGSSL